MSERRSRILSFLALLTAMSIVAAMIGYFLPAMNTLNVDSFRVIESESADHAK